MKYKIVHTAFLALMLSYCSWAQELGSSDDLSEALNEAHNLAFEGKHGSARNTLNNYLNKFPENGSARFLLARTYSWDGNYDEARKHFNKITSEDKKSRVFWIAAVKNELYARNNATALGLTNKALIHLPGDIELERLQALALANIKNTSYTPYTKDETIQKPIGKQKKPAKKLNSKKKATTKKSEEKKKLNNIIGFTNAFTVFDKVYEPTVYSTIEYKRQTKVGSVIPRINYSNRLKTNGIQYDIDFYPKFSKMFYAYLNYGFSNSTIYPNHKAGGDLYANLPGAMEASAGMRFISFDTRDIYSIASSIGHYSGNYYFSLRSFITPKPGGVATISGNLLVRKYRRDGENYSGISFGMGYAPEFRQLTLDGVVLSETLLYLESQRLNLEYQFTPKNAPTVYRTRIGLVRQELTTSPGNFFWAVSAGLTYRVKF
ncbi:YaiO family outer membrane beta-barrel protein [Muriicola sp. Z0-33]|uniref:YaiO family outer membrane beta-barrel protein n=1 Tax=Muriicola sp. Z0-33 TaxID=2816957 RepID=UPI002238C85C|nr:YaiO family outer membrane beta-barrel protein [Muriicola sp. Z0-33]MCW5515198.1 YaiO family outer membrane beta-barrel protein [Muriicola sp. Z0-33]